MIAKYLLLIDDESEQEEIWREYLEEIAKKLDLTIDFDYVNPLDFMDKENGFEELKTHLKDNFLDKKIDLVATDYNWSEQSKDSAYKLVDFIRQYNKICNLFMYSGTPHEMLNFILNDADVTNRQEIKRISKILTKSGISDFVSRKKENLIRVTEQLLITPSLGLQIENHLHKYKHLKFDYGYELFRNKSIEHILTEVRMQTATGANYTQFILEKGINHMIDLEIPKM